MLQGILSLFVFVVAVIGLITGCLFYPVQTMLFILGFVLGVLCCDIAHLGG
jgi:hypothetical protein